MSTTRADKTALHRASLSRPVACALNDGLIGEGRSFFDYGCGRGDDLLRLHRMHIPVSGWDPAFFPDEARTPADVVNLGYVVNVIEDPDERRVVLAAAWNLARKILVVSARLDWEAASAAVNFQSDGIVTGKNTFQKFYTQEELRSWIQGVLDRRPVAAGPGIFYVFRDEADEQAFAVNRVSGRPRNHGVTECQELVASHKELIEPLIAFVTERGRLPVAGELPVFSQLTKAFGGPARAFSLVRRASSAARWERIRRDRRADVLVYLALAAFPKRPKFSTLSEELRNDIRAFFGSYKSGCAEADAALFSAGDQGAVDQACGMADVGKLLPDALYVHHTVVQRLLPVLRIYEGCARQFAGTVEGTTLVKLSRRHARVSYLVYKDFDRVAHPVLLKAIVADLKHLRLHLRDYTHSTNPPVLHRKELLVAPDYPARQRFARLTVHEERLGLLDATRTIGTSRGWRSVLADHGVSIRGHRILRDAPADRA